MTHLVKIHLDPVDIFVSGLGTDSITHESWLGDKKIKPRTTSKYDVVEDGIMFDGILLFNQTVKQIYELLKS